MTATEFSDANCYVLPDGSCVGVNCVHDAPPRISKTVPVWLLDIDGVINAVTPKGLKPPYHVHHLSPWRDVEVNGGDAMWRIVTADSVIAFINEVDQRGLAEIRWHTTWQHHASNISVHRSWPIGR